MKYKKITMTVIFCITALLVLSACSYNYVDNEAKINSYDNDVYEETQVSRAAVDIQEELEAIKNADSLVWGVAEDSIVTFGAYEQDGNIFNGPEPIKWYVINNDNNVATLYSVYCLDCRPYHNNSLNLESVNWSNCSLRDWLNDNFYNEAFNDGEKQYLVVSAVTGENSNDFDETTSAYVQLPNAGNVSGWFWTNENMIAEFTEYAKSKYDSLEPYRYWTREMSEKSGSGYGTVIDADGEIMGSSYYWLIREPVEGVPLSDVYGVRPMIMVKYADD